MRKITKGLISLMVSCLFLSISCTLTEVIPVKTHHMEKPKTVDKDAIWKSDAWHKGKMSKEGNPIGRYTVWNHKGVMIENGNFDKSGKITWFKSYFPDGSIGRTIEYNEELNKTSVRWESHPEYCERLLTPFNENEKGHAEKTLDGKIGIKAFQEIINASQEGVSFYNESGEFVRIWTYENYQTLITKHTQKKKNESWKSALERLENYWNDYKVQRIKDGDSEIENDYFTISFQSDVTEKDLENAEKRLGITFPESYKTFVLEMGLIKFGDDNHYTQKMLHPDEIHSIKHLLDDAGGFDDYFQIPLEKTEKVICFFEDQIDYQYEGWIAFDCIDQTTEEKNIIRSIGCKNIYEWEREIGKESGKVLNSMDLFISNYVDVLIAEREP